MDTSESWGDLPTSFKSRRSQKSMENQRSWNNEDSYNAQVEEYFDKRFHFQISDNDWQLPLPDDMFQFAKWKDNYLQKMKHQLNSVKNKLNDYNLDDWHKHTRSNNKAGDIQWRLRNEFELEFLTQAWCKFYENASSFPLVPDTVESLLSVHLCEAPGAFIVSLNHYLKLNRPGVRWDWLATTLNPYYEGNPLSNMINDDRFILQTLEHWNFGVDMTGNLMLMDNMMHLAAKARGKGEAMLVTADGSIDCQDDPGEQEAVVAALHYCEVVAALHILTEGGSFLLKMFTMFECDSVCLMYLLCCSFASVTVNKPATSKEGNSEVYVVCLGYCGSDAMRPWFDVLDKHYGPTTCQKSMFISGDIPSEFLDQLEDCAAFFMKHQIDTIENNIATYSRKNVDRFATKRLKHLIAVEFMDRYGIKSLDRADDVVGREKLKQTFTMNLDPRSTDGATFNELRQKTDMDPNGLLLALSQELDGLGLKWPYAEHDIKWLKFPTTQTRLHVQVGKPVGVVRSSKFCLGRLLEIRHRVLDLALGAFRNRRGVDELFRVAPVEGGGGRGGGGDDEGPLVERMRRKFPGCTVLDFRQPFRTSLATGRNSAAESNALSEVLASIDRLWRDDTLVLLGLPLLTQLCVGLVRAVAHMFDRVGFVPPARCGHAVVFHRFGHRDAATRHFLEGVEGEVDRCREAGEGQCVLALLPIDFLSGGETSDAVNSSTAVLDEAKGGGEDSVAVCESRDFYTCVLETNHASIAEQTQDIISQLLPPRPELALNYHLDPTTD